MAAAGGSMQSDIYKFKAFTIRKIHPRSDVIPKGRSGHRIVSNDACVYSFGGFNPHVYVDENLAIGNIFISKMFKELWKFNVAKQGWEKLEQYTQSMPKQLASNAVLRKGNTLIVHGGTGMPFGLVNINKTYVADLKSGTSFSVIPAQGKYPSEKYGQAMVLDGNCLYVVGGTNGFYYFMDVHCLNLKTLTWEEKYLTRALSSTGPEGRYRHEIALHNSRIMVFGGGTDMNAFGFEEIPAFNVITNTWETIKTFPDKNTLTFDEPTFPSARRCHGCIHIPGDDIKDPEVVICGGFDGYRTFSDMWKLNLRTFEWTKCVCSLPYPLYFHSTCVSPNGKMHLFGGICENVHDRENYARTNEIFSMWAMIPTLREMCWEALLHYCPDLYNVPKLKLMDLGVPIDLVERLEH